MKLGYLAIFYVFFAISVMLLGFAISLAIPGVFIILLVLYYLFILVPKSKSGLSRLLWIIGISFVFVSGIIMIISPRINSFPFGLTLGLAGMLCSIGNLVSSKKEVKNSQK